MPSRSIVIPEPCHERWHHMTAADKGRFCDSCEKVVVDFTEKSQQEILTIYDQHEGNLCGRFRSSQIRDTHQAAGRFVRRFVLALLVAFGPWLFALARVSDSILLAGLNTEWLTPVEKVGDLELGISVRDQQTGQALPGIVVELWLAGDHGPMAVASNELGDAVFDVKGAEIEQAREATLVVVAEGYQAYSLELGKLQELKSKDLLISLVKGITDVSDLPGTYWVGERPQRSRYSPLEGEAGLVGEPLIWGQVGAISSESEGPTATPQDAPEVEHLPVMGKPVAPPRRNVQHPNAGSQMGEPQPEKDSPMPIHHPSDTSQVNDTVSDNLIRLENHEWTLCHGVETGIIAVMPDSGELPYEFNFQADSLQPIFEEKGGLENKVSTDMENQEEHSNSTIKGQGVLVEPIYMGTGVYSYDATWESEVVKCYVSQPSPLQPRTATEVSYLPEYLWDIGISGNVSVFEHDPPTEDRSDKGGMEQSQPGQPDGPRPEPTPKSDAILPTRQEGRTGRQK